MSFYENIGQPSLNLKVICWEFLIGHSVFYVNITCQILWWEHNSQQVNKYLPLVLLVTSRSVDSALSSTSCWTIAATARWWITWCTAVTSRKSVMDRRRSLRPRPEPWGSWSEARSSRPSVWAAPPTPITTITRWGDQTTTVTIIISYADSHITYSSIKHGQQPVRLYLCINH